MKALISALGILVISAGAASAQPNRDRPPPPPPGLAGTWSMTTVSEGGEVCVFTLGTDGVIGGWQVYFPRSCFTQFEVRDIAGWRISPEDNALELIAPTRQARFRFIPTGDGAYIADREEGDDLIISPGDPAVMRPPPPSEIMSGMWKISGIGGAPLCRYLLTSDERGRSGRATIQPEGCAGDWVNRGVVRWTIRGKELTLWNARNAPISSFRQVDPFTWENRLEMELHRGQGSITFFGKDMGD